LGLRSPFDHYQNHTRLPPVTSIHKDACVPEAPLSCDLLPSALQLEYKWLQTVYTAIDGMSDDVEMNGNYSWAAYNASLQ
jgi:hypothetical protein